MADVTLKYKGATIGELSESGNKTLKTAGKYCEADILLEFIKSEGLPPIQHFQYIQPETKDYTTGGFASYFIQTYLNKGNGLYFGFVNDITESTNQYKAVSFIYPIMTITGVSQEKYQSFWHRPINWVVAGSKDSSAVSSISFYLYEGAIIDIFFIPFSEF